MTPFEVRVLHVSTGELLTDITNYIPNSATLSNEAGCVFFSLSLYAWHIVNSVDIFADTAQGT